MASASAAPETHHSKATFHQLLVNTLVTGVTSSFLWFALTFWAYLETKSVVITGVIGGAFGIASAVLAPMFGAYVDRNTKHKSMMLATLVSSLCFVAATAVFLLIDVDTLLQLDRPWFWVLTTFTLFGSVASSVRSIAMSTCVTLLVPEDERDKANGLVGSVTGVSFAITSVFSGIVIGWFGMGWAYYISLALTSLALVHLMTIEISEPEIVHTDEIAKVDIKGAIEAIKAVPGLGMLIAFAAFNNLLTGVFMALMDPYGLSLVSVETWGILWGFISLALIGSGLAVAKWGLGKSPMRVILIGNLINWTTCCFFTVPQSIVPVVIGMFIWLGSVPVIEAAEQTVLQKSIPYERQGRVFGFAQLVENAASPLTAIFLAPIVEATAMPFMTNGSGADWIGSWWGTGPHRGIALVFTFAGVLGVIVTGMVRVSRSYRDLATQNRNDVLAVS